MLRVPCANSHIPARYILYVVVKEMEETRLHWSDVFTFLEKGVSSKKVSFKPTSQRVWLFICVWILNPDHLAAKELAPLGTFHQSPYRPPRSFSSFGAACV